MQIKCTVIDAGSRYGLHPSWSDLRGLVDFHLFEMDKKEANRLEKKYEGDSSIKVYPLALHSELAGVKKFNISNHRGLNSLYDRNDQYLEREKYMVKEFNSMTKEETFTNTIDNIFKDIDIHFLKLDTEGCDLDILKGSEEKLLTSVLAVRSEVLFAPVFKNAPLFGQVHQFLLDHGMELLNLEYDGKGNKAGRYTMPNRYGKLITSDGLWVVNTQRLFRGKSDRLVHDIVRFSLFLMLNNATDLAVDTLVRAVEEENVCFDDLFEDPLLQFLHKKLLLLFKDLLNLPMIEEDDVVDTYRTIFGREFPSMNRFYESDMFN